MKYTVKRFSKFRSIKNLFKNFLQNIKGFFNKTFNYLKSKRIISNSIPLKENKFNSKIKRFSYSSFNIQAGYNDLKLLNSGEYNDIPQEYEGLVYCCIDSENLYNNSSNELKELVDNKMIPCINQVYSLYNIITERASNKQEGFGDHSRIFEIYCGDIEFYYSWDKEEWMIYDKTNNSWYNINNGHLGDAVQSFCSKEHDAFLKRTYEILENDEELNYVIGDLDNYIYKLNNIINKNI